MGRIHSCGKGISSSALPHKRTPLSWLSISSQDVVKILAAADSSISSINSGDEEGWVPLHSAASSGNIEIVEILLSRADPSSFFPISARFSSSKTFSDLKVTNILPLKVGATPKFSQRTQLVTENYQVV